MPVKKGPAEDGNGTCTDHKHVPISSGRYPDEQI